jgi:methylated-DNA-[protein]-cysteine S-methyltransferase
MRYYKTTLKSPIGRLILVASSEKLSLIHFDNPKAKNKFKLPEGLIEAETPILEETKRQLSEYFIGQRIKFNLPLELRGTPFQNEVWKALININYGEVQTYSEIAHTIGSPRAVRAVGLANSQNSIPIIVPCHRVIGKNGKLTGFSGGLEVKEFLFNLERKNFGNYLNPITPLI